MQTLSSISCERDVFPFSTKTRSVSSGFPDRSQIGLGLDWVGLESLTRGASPKRTAERVFQLAVVQLYNSIDHFLWSTCDRVSMRSLVVVEETNIVFHTRLLQFSIYQLLECNKLEVFLEE